jgi:predicted dehydrogenase
MCIKNNVNFFVEKPLAGNLEECKQLCSNLKGTDLVHAVGYSKRFLDTFVKGKELLDSNMLGELVYVKSSMYVSQLFSSGKGWRYKKTESNGGVLLEFASHLVDLLLWYFGSIKYVATMVKSYYSKEVEDFAHSAIEFETGLKGYLDTSWSIRNHRLPEIMIEIHGTNGMMILNDDFVRVKLDETDGNFPAGDTTIYKQALSSGTLIDIAGPEYTKEDIHVVDCARTKKQTMINSFDASRAQSVIDSMYSSSTAYAFRKVDYVI